MKAPWLAICLIACSSTPPTVAWPTAERLDETRGVHERVVEREPTVSEVPAEPFSAAWVDEAEPHSELDPTAPRHAWVKTDACAEPASQRPADPNDLHEALVAAVLAPGEGVQAEASLQVFATFRAPRALHLLRTRDGTRRLRAIRVPERVWSDLLGEVVAAGGHPIAEATRHELLARGIAARVTAERQLDEVTSRLFIGLWREVIGRAQVVEEVNPSLVLGHFTGYTLLHGDKTAVTRSPQDGSVLGDAILATEHLEHLLDAASSDDLAHIERARDLMRDSIGRTRRKEACLRHYDLPLR